METLREEEQLGLARRQSKHFTKLGCSTTLKPHFMAPKSSRTAQNKRNNSINKINFRSKKEFYERFISAEDDVTADGTAREGSDLTPKASQASLLHRQSTKRNSLALGASTPGRNRSITDSTGGGGIVTQLFGRDTSNFDRSDSGDGATPTQGKRASKIQRTVERRVSDTAYSRETGESHTAHCRETGESDTAHRQATVSLMQHRVERRVSITQRTIRTRLSLTLHMVT